MMKAEAKVQSLTFQKKLIVTQYEAFKVMHFISVTNVIRCNMDV